MQDALKQMMQMPDIWSKLRKGGLSRRLEVQPCTECGYSELWPTMENRNAAVDRRTIQAMGG